MELLKKLSGKKICIVGTGYLGNHLGNFLASHSYQYQFQLDIYSRKNIDKIKGVDCDYLFNCAGITGDFRKKNWEMIESNLGLTRFLLEHVKIGEVYIALSSTRIYGFSSSPDIVYTEEDASKNVNDHLNLDFIYDGTKKLLESLLWNSPNKSSYKIVICRLSNIFGRYTERDLDESTYLKLMIRKSVSNEKLVVNQNINSSKGYIYIDDAINGIIYCAISSQSSSIYNICSGSSYSIKHWLDYLNINYSIEQDDLPPANYARNSIQKAQSELNYIPTFFLHNLDFHKIYSNEPNRTI